ncbi:MAG: hypothetical protein IPN34_24305 [Planctomycetes bacterium]|nr:hypothetical protein [Planctomycetota bacterium]
MSALSIVLALATASLPQSPPTAAAVTEPGRTLTRPLNVVLGGSSREATERTLIVLLDPSPELVKGGFVDAFTAAIAANAKTLTQTRLGLAVTGAKDPLVVEPTLEHQAVVRAMQTEIAREGGYFQNVFATARAAAGAFSGSSGERVLLIAALENGDVEDDVEATVATLQKAKVRVEMLTSEATLADSYWAENAYAEKPRGATMTGADGAVIDLPWGWLFQLHSANESTAAGHAPWGYSRLAAATEGRVYLHANSQQTAHSCGFRTQCLFCTGDHAPEDDAWSSVLLAQLAPLTASRAETLATLGKDPSFRAMVETWRAAAKAGLLRSEPPVKLSPTSASLDRARTGRSLGLLETASFSRHAKSAEDAAEEARQLGDALAAELARIPRERTTPRCAAAAQYTVVLLQLTRVNLITYAAWCRDLAPQLVDGRADELLSPEQPAVQEEQRVTGVSFSNLSLCHGVKPFYAVELPGGETLRAELERLDALCVDYLSRWGKSPFGAALRQNGIARFWPAMDGGGRATTRARPKTDQQPVGPTTPRRPTRAAGGSTGTPSGPTSGGGG